MLVAACAFVAGQEIVDMVAAVDIDIAFVGRVACLSAAVVWPFAVDTAVTGFASVAVAELIAAAQMIAVAVIAVSILAIVM